jgi:sulfatase maturation enzyme AslB (radical SAM superfamily)
MLNNIKILHLEPTDACNLACPQCAREFDNSFNKKNLHHLTVKQIKNLISDDAIKQLDKMFMCGTYGDPAAGKYTLDIFRYFRSINPNITLGINSNGSLKSSDWWAKLASILNQPLDYAVWSIDGLSDTNSVYRVNSNWSTIMKNAQSFINAGGYAHWDMLVFDHNQHQVDDAIKLARGMGFKYFRAKVSRRFDLIPIKFLKPPKQWQTPQHIQGEIQCQALNEASVYISAEGKLYPCCWLATTEEFTIDQFDLIKQSWISDTPNRICQQTCSGSHNIFKDQWQREISF